MHSKKKGWNRVPTLLRRTGLEPAQLAPLAPQASVSTNSTTAAIAVSIAKEKNYVKEAKPIFKTLCVSRHWDSTALAPLG